MCNTIETSPGADPGFPRGGANCPGGRQHTILLIFPENCMKSKEFGCPGGGGRAPCAPPKSATAVFCYCFGWYNKFFEKSPSGKHLVFFMKQLGAHFIPFMTQLDYLLSERFRHFLYIISKESLRNQWRIQDIQFFEIFPKTAWNRKNLGAQGGGGTRGALNPPLLPVGHLSFFSWLAITQGNIGSGAST